MRSLKRDLFERRLWPLAIVLVAAIAAVPFLLHGHHGGAAIAAPPTATGPTPAVTGTPHPASDTHRATTPTSRTRDPFQERAASTANAHHSTTHTTTTSTTATVSQTTSTAPVTTTPATTPSTSTATATTPVVSTPPAVTTPATTTPGGTSDTGATRTQSWDIFSVDLRVGAPGSPVAHHNLARLTPLPGERTPQAMYLGVTGHGRRAVFALGAGVEVRTIGAGHLAAACEPSRVDCALVVIPAGGTIALRYVSSTGTQRTLLLRVSRITAKLTRSATAVKAARAHVSGVGLCDLKLGDPIGFFDPADESVKLPSIAACRRDRRAVPFPGSLGAGSSVRG